VWYSVVHLSCPHFPMHPSFGKEKEGGGKVVEYLIGPKEKR
jgi:hypothetical protein